MRKDSGGKLGIRKEMSVNITAFELKCLQVGFTLSRNRKSVTRKRRGKVRVWRRTPELFASLGGQAAPRLQTENGLSVVIGSS